MKSVRRIAVALFLAVCMAAAAGGCHTPHSELVRPDGSPVPYPGFETNVVPWAYTNQVAP